MLLHTLSDAWMVTLLAVMVSMVLDGLALLLPAVARPLYVPAKLARVLLLVLEQRLNRSHRGAQTLRARGVIVTLLVLAVVAALGWGITVLGARDTNGGIMLEVVTLALCCSATPLLLACRRFAAMHVLARNEQLLSIVQPFAARNALLHDRHGMTRTLMAAVAHALVSHLAAPVLGYVLFGLPGTLAVRFFATAAHAWQGDARRTDSFAASVLTVWRAVAWLPSVLAATALALAAWCVPGTRGFSALKGWWLYAHREEGVLAVLAYAVGISLGGPKRGAPNPNQWLGDGSARPSAGALTRSIWLFWAARLLMVCVLAGAMGHVAQ
jgi:adenosylcobinamide-phosphate synthase